MTKVGFLNYVVNVFFVAFMLQLLLYQEGYTIRLVLLYAIIQVLVGRYKDNVLLIWDEIKLILLSHFWFFYYLCYLLKSLNVEWC